METLRVGFSRLKVSVKMHIYMGDNFGTWFLVLYNVIMVHPVRIGVIYVNWIVSTNYV
jgi:hypothetical protein